MVDQAIKANLADPLYRERHFAAVKAIETVGCARWYDGHFVRRLEAAKLVLNWLNPSLLGRFLREFEVLSPPPGFAEVLIEDVFDDTTRERIIAHCRDGDTSAGGVYGSNERSVFDRDVIWNTPFFSQLQRDILPMVSEIAGRPLEIGYNFLSLYRGAGICDVHMDDPLSMYTFDYCIEQSDPWPIHFSRVVDWTAGGDLWGWDGDAIKKDPGMGFRSHAMKPNQALFFAGSSQWHYRDAITPSGFCNLLFFHYYPMGCEGLVHPRHWAAHFNIPELQPLCDLLALEDRQRPAAMRSSSSPPVSATAD